MRVIQIFVLRFDICSHLYQVVVEKKLMRERKLTRHDIGRENFVSEVSISFAWHMIICGLME
jgi:valyl-tRNA synthetase